MPKNLERRYGQNHLHFVTCSCYQRLPLLRSATARDLFLKILDDVRTQYQFSLVGYVVMPEHVHLLIGEPGSGTPSTVMQVLKQRVSKELRRPGRKTAALQTRSGKEAPNLGQGAFWQTRFYDFNVWSVKKRNEKLHYMHFNPVKRKLVSDPSLWFWSSYRFYRYAEKLPCTPNPPAW